MAMKNYLKLGLIVVIAVALIGGYYYYLSHRNAKAPEDSVEITELDEIISKQLDSDYPPTPREVVKFYNRIIECVYADGYDEEQFDQIIGQARKLMDDELLEENQLEDYKKQLQEEIQTYKNNSQQIIQTTVCDSDEVEKKEIDGRKCAYVKATYFLKSGKGQFEKTFERYLLRQDDKGNWKILAYYLINGEE